MKHHTPISDRLHELAKHLTCGSLPASQVAHLLNAEADAVYAMETNTANLHHNAKLAQEHSAALSLYLARIQPGPARSTSVDGNTGSEPRR